MKRTTKPKHQAEAFTLLEVMAALAILSISLVILVRSQTESLNNVRRIQTYERGMFIAENQLHWTMIDLNEAQDWNELSTLEGEDGPYLWRVEMQPAEMERGLDSQITMLRIKAMVSWPEGRGEGYIELETWYLWGKDQ